MTRITLDILNSVEKNAEVYFNKSKKAKKKLEKTLKALERIKKKKEKIDRAKEQEKEKQITKTKQEWYEKLLWILRLHRQRNEIASTNRGANHDNCVPMSHTSTTPLVSQPAPDWSN